MKSFTLALLSLLLSATVCAGSKIYQWIDDEGNVHFSNIPAAEVQTEEVDLPDINLYTPTEQVENQQDSQGQRNVLSTGNSQQQSGPPMQMGSGPGGSGQQGQGMMMPPGMTP